MIHIFVFYLRAILSIPHPWIRNPILKVWMNKTKHASPVFTSCSPASLPADLMDNAAAFLRAFPCPQAHVSFHLSPHFQPEQSSLMSSTLAAPLGQLAPGSFPALERTVSVTGNSWRRLIQAGYSQWMYYCSCLWHVLWDSQHTHTYEEVYIQAPGHNLVLNTTAETEHETFPDTLLYLASGKGFAFQCKCHLRRYDTQTTENPSVIWTLIRSCSCWSNKGVACLSSLQQLIHTAWKGWYSLSPLTCFISHHNWTASDCGTSQHLKWRNLKLIN